MNSNMTNSSNMYQKMVAENPEKYPARMGMAWTKDEVTDLLSAVKNGDSIETIAHHHERTVGSIRARLLYIATDMHNTSKKSLEEIQLTTGLTGEQIKDAIEKRQEIAKEKTSPRKTSRSEPTMSEVVAMISDIQITVHKILTKLNQPT
jgi:hypothetical protein